MSRQLHSHNRLLLALSLVLVVAGLVLRLLQFGGQVLLDDEWHAVHQLLSGKSWSELFSTFGHADYSIPLTMLYWFEARWFGLDELGMRWPMLVAGLLTLPAFVYWAWTRVSPAVATLFAFLLAFSPMLFVYSRTARPYALTLLLSFVALYCFNRWFESSRPRYGAMAAYILCASGAVWLHSIAGPFVVAPFVYQGFRSLLHKDWKALWRLFFLGLVTATVMGLLLLPPLLSSGDALLVKAGSAVFSAETFFGVWYVWLGTSNGILTILLLVIAAIGLPEIARSDSMMPTALLGIGLTLVMVMVTQPEWSQHAVTMGRYLLPMLPILLLAVAAGWVRVLRWCLPLHGVFRPLMALASAVLLFAYLGVSPIRPLLNHPNSQTTHSIYQFALQSGANPIAEYQQQHLPESSFWNDIADTGGRGDRLAVAPFYFESYNWGAPAWERVSNKRAIPLMLSGLCTEMRRGEVPDNNLFRFRNVYHPDDLTGDRSPVNWVVLTKPFIGYSNGNDQALVGADSYPGCRAKLVELFGEPDFEDDALLAFKRPS